MFNGCHWHESVSVGLLSSLSAAFYQQDCFLHLPTHPPSVLEFKVALLLTMFYYSFVTRITKTLCDGRAIIHYIYTFASAKD